MKPYYANKELAERLATMKSGDTTVDVRLLKEQPYENSQLCRVVASLSEAHFGLRNVSWSIQEIPLRYPSGEYDLYVPKEMYGKYSCTFIVPQKSDIRIKVTTSVMRVQDIDRDTWHELTFPFRSDWIEHDKAFRMFANWWNSKHAKPRKVGDGYVSYPYDGDVSDFARAYYKEGVYGHKGLPLEIYANPHIELNQLEVV